MIGIFELEFTDEIFETELTPKVLCVIIKTRVSCEMNCSVLYGNKI